MRSRANAKGPPAASSAALTVIVRVSGARKHRAMARLPARAPRVFRETTRAAQTVCVASYILRKSGVARARSIL